MLLPLHLNFIYQPSGGAGSSDQYIRNGSIIVRTGDKVQKRQVLPEKQTVNYTEEVQSI